MEMGELKPVLAALVLPPAGPLLLALLGLVLARRRRGLGLGLAGLALLLALVLTSHSVGRMLAGALLPPLAAAQPQQVRAMQAVVVLGGGLLHQAPEYGAGQPNANTLARLRYGAWLARRTGLPVAFAGGVGWAAAGMGAESEGAVARRVLQEDWGIAPRWVEDRSRDTEENARNLAQVLLPQQVRRIALVTDAAHVPRAADAFRAAGFEVLPAPTGLPGPLARPLLEVLPSAAGAALCREVLREWLARRLS
jgi:uncharacterized SAM-binding protein YcdF (DUF218 family)